MLLSNTVKVKINKANRKYYLQKGYQVELGDEVDIPYKDVPRYSQFIITVKCDYCGKLISKKVSDRNSQIEKCKSKGVEYTDSCEDCKGEKQKSTWLQTIGVENPMQLPEVKEKLNDTMEAKYGTRKWQGAPEIREKVQKTVRERYHGEAPMCDPAIRQKSRETCLKKYGYDNPMKSPEYRAGVWKDNYRNNALVSRQQVHICELYGGELNYFLYGRFIDIILINDNLAIEYDGSGHKLTVAFGRLSEEEFEKKERGRENVIIGSGLRLLRLESKHDKLPTDLTLNEILDIALYNFNINGNKICRCNLDTFDIIFE